RDTTAALLSRDLVARAAPGTTPEAATSHWSSALPARHGRRFGRPPELVGLPNPRVLPGCCPASGLRLDVGWWRRAGVGTSGDYPEMESRGRLDRPARTRVGGLLGGVGTLDVVAQSILRVVSPSASIDLCTSLTDGLG